MSMNTTSKPILHHLSLLPLTTYSYASRLQSILFQLHLLHKSRKKKDGTILETTSFSSPSPPPPFIITSQFTPTYTLGRREASTTPSEYLSKLILLEKKAVLVKTSRGGRISFHGPGQIVIYPIIDLTRHKLSPKCYVRFLEDTTIRTLGRFGVEGMRSSDPGVWLHSEKRRKIASLGVGLRRWVTSHGVGLNVCTDPTWWEGIVACGLEGVEMASMRDAGWKSGDGEEGKCDEDVRMVGDAFVEEAAYGLGCEEVKKISEEEVWEMGREAGLEVDSAEEEEKE